MKQGLYIAVVFAFLSVLTAPVQAEICDMPEDHASADTMPCCDHKQDMTHAAPNDIYAPVMEKMMRDMPQPLGDANADYMRGMIVHHQAAIDMSETALQEAHSSDVRTMAQNVITAQKNEIIVMREWLTKHGYPQPETTSHH